MRPLLRTAVSILCAISLSTVLAHRALHADSVSSRTPGPANRDAPEARSVDNTPEGAQQLAAIVGNIEPISQETRARRNVAQATFCFPQNVLGTLCYGLLRLSGNVLNAADLNEVEIVVTGLPIAVSLGRYIFVSQSLLTENMVRHEYGHTMQGYKHGPFYLLFEGSVSFVQAVISLFSPSFAERYYDRWPENEADELGGVTR